MTRRRFARLTGSLVAATLLFYCHDGRAQELRDECAAPSSVISLGAPLTHTGDRLLHGQSVKIVAIGSSSTAGAGASDAAHAYPGQLAAALERRFPQGRIVVLNKGINGEETPDMLVRFQRDVFDEHPDLVVWQTGSNEILRKHDVERFHAAVLEGLVRLHAAGIETVLMDAQYAPRILENPAYAAFNDELRELASAANVALLDRFEAMRYWLAKRQDGTSRVTSAIVGADDVHMTDAGYRCVGRLLASLIVADMPALASR
ncbi:MAG: SGNH/GDSL hydrolase family protein [Alphaproteobacteria bacterium]